MSVMSNNLIILVSASKPHSVPITPRPRSGSTEGARINLKLALSTMTDSEISYVTTLSNTTSSTGSSGVLPMSSLSTPRTPPPTINMNHAFPGETKTNFFTHGKSLSFAGGGGSLNERVNHNQSFSSGLGGSTSSGSSFLTMRECDETMRDLRKENFNLKLRIYFLEERLGTARLVAAAGSKEELVQNNVELKVGKSALNLQLELEKQMVKFSNLLFLFVDKFIC